MDRTKFGQTENIWCTMVEKITAGGFNIFYTIIRMQTGRDSIFLESSIRMASKTVPRSIERISKKRQLFLKAYHA